MFHNLKVLELASVLAGPSVGQFFAELGAEVIKVENPSTGGDVTRSWKMPGEPTDDRSAYFCSVNWGKKSVTADLSTPDGREIVHKLAQKSDVVIASYKPGDPEKLGVSYDDLRAHNDRVIYGQITGYGPKDERVGYDAVIQAESGFMSLNGESDGQPLKMPVALIDVLAAHQLKEAILLALLKREGNGQGSYVEVSLIQAAVSSLVNQASNWLVGKTLPRRQGSLHPNIAPYGEVVITRDGKKLLLAVGTDRQFIDLCEVLGIRHRALELRFSTNQARVANRTALLQILQEKIRELSTTDLLPMIREKRIPSGMIVDVKEALETPEGEKLIIQRDGLAGVKSFVSSIGNTEPGKLLPPPKLGEHNDEILARLMS